jgi:hypothetical protein
LTGAGFKIFQLLWAATFLLAIGGPIAGLWMRYSASTTNSQLVLGSRAGFAVAPRDAALVRYTMGRADGIRAGDRIVALNGIPLPEPMPVTYTDLTDHANDRAYSAMDNVLFGADRSAVPLKIRDSDGRIRSVTVTTGEQHIDAATREIHISPKLLGFLDLLHVLAYPILLWVAFSLYTRNPGQPVPLLLSFSILLSMAAEQPSSVFLRQIEIPRAINILLYDLGNISLLTAVLLFPDARLRPRRILIALSLLPVLFFLSGSAYQLAFVCAFVVGLTVFVARLRADAGPTRQQLKLLFVGLALYPAFRTVSVLFDYIKYDTVSLSQQLLFETLAGLTYALAVLSLVLVLFSALRRHRLDDADALFSRSAMIAVVSLTIAAFFGAASAGLQAAADAVVGQGAGPWPTIAAAGAAVLLINPLQTRIYRGTKRVFQKDLFKFRTELPKKMDDLRETASAATLLHVALDDIVRGLRATHAAALINGRVAANVGHETKDVRRWLRSTEMPNPLRLSSDRTDHLFPVRLPLRTATDPSSLIGWIVLGPRPDGSLYSREERQALLEVEEAISRAVDVSRQRQEAESADRRWRERQEKRLRAVEDQLAELSAANRPWKKLPA